MTMMKRRRSASMKDIGRTARSAFRALQLQLYASIFRLGIDMLMNARSLVTY